MTNTCIVVFITLTEIARSDERLYLVFQAREMQMVLDGSCETFLAAMA